MNPLYQKRRSGILLHPASLPGPMPRGQICHDAYRFVEFLESTGCTVWQMLPLGPTHADLSPYLSMSAYAGNIELISLDWLRDRQLIEDSHCPDYECHRQRLEQASQEFFKQKNHPLVKDYKRFCKKAAHWLNDYALFMAIREQQGKRCWLDWPEPLRLRDKQTLKTEAKKLAGLIAFHEFTQFVFYQQWLGLKKYANERGILFFGDMPIYVSLDSADTWANPDYFKLDKKGQPSVVAGVPPDYFSETGQRWGNPLYDWKTLEKNQFEWWQQRLAWQLELFDIARIDHFRGFAAYWEIPASEETAINGRWVKAPGGKLLSALKKAFPELPLVAEDLGVITDDVNRLRQRFDLPGMKILQFAFDGDPGNEYLPHNHEFKTVVYTGTHDNDTSLSWYQQLSPQVKEQLKPHICGIEHLAPHQAMIQQALASVACLAVLPMQDIMGLGAEARMNTPGTIDQNWRWRFQWHQLNPECAGWLNNLNTQYNR